MTGRLTLEDATRLQDCVARGALAVIPTDTVYGLCCDPEDEAAARALYELKGITRERSAAVMFFSLERALEALAELDPAEATVLTALLPGPVTILLQNRGSRFAAACGPDGASVGIRVPRLAKRLAGLAAVSCGVMQSSANMTGMPDARTLAGVPPRLRRGADLILDGGELPGTASTVLDLRGFARSRDWRIVRQGALSCAAIETTLRPLI